MTDTAKTEIHKREFKNIRGDSFTQWAITVPGASARVENRVVGALLDEYAAMKAVEAAARRVTAGIDLSAVADLRAALAALDAIRKPPTGKTGEAVV